MQTPVSREMSVRGTYTQYRCQRTVLRQTSIAGKGCRARTGCVVYSSTPADAGRSTDTVVQQSLIERTYSSNWRSPLPDHDHSDPSCRPIIALGKFDALHKGHQALAAAALQLGGSPVLLSFSGMGAVLGWQPRKPLVAPCDRPRVLDLWAQQLGAVNPTAAAGDGSSSGDGASGDQSQQQQQQQQQQGLKPIRQHYIPFSEIRSMSPEAFVELIVNDLKASGVVAGSNYRFGYRAAGDSGLLHQLCSAAGLPVMIVDLVGPAEPGAVGVVSSSKTREMLSACRIEAARKSLGRPYRLVAAVKLRPSQQQQQQEVQLSSTSSSSSSANTSSWQQTDLGQRDTANSKPLHQHQQQQQQQEQQQPCQGAEGLYIHHTDFLNQHPAPGVYLCNIQLLLGATAHDDLLQIQQVLGLGTAGSHQSSSSSGSGTGNGDHVGSSRDRQLDGEAVGQDITVQRGFNISGSRCFAAVTGQHQQIEFQEDGLLLPAAVMQAACSIIGSSSSSSSSSGSSSSSLRFQGSGLDPVAWDTDDNESVDSQDASCGVDALLVIDFERCLRQVCSVDRPGSSGTAASSAFAATSSGIAAKL